MTSDMTVEDLNQKHPQYEAWGLSVRGNMEKMVIFIAYQVPELCFLYCTVGITSFLWMTGNRHLWNTNPYFEKN